MIDGRLEVGLEQVRDALAYGVLDEGLAMLAVGWAYSVGYLDRFRVERLTQAFLERRTSLSQYPLL